jgi:hypothetical protein
MDGWKNYPRFERTSIYLFDNQLQFYFCFDLWTHLCNWLTLSFIIYSREFKSRRVSMDGWKNYPRFERTSIYLFDNQLQFLFCFDLWTHLCNWLTLSFIIYSREFKSRRVSMDGWKNYPRFVGSLDWSVVLCKCLFRKDARKIWTGCLLGFLRSLGLDSRDINVCW